MKSALSRLGAALCVTFVALAITLLVPPAALALERTPAPAEATVYLIAPQDGDTVSSPFTVKFGLTGMGVAPAGVDQPKTGHHHLLIDLDTLPALDEPLMATDQLKHFGGGQTETTLTLPPGEHTLQLLLANYTHIPHQPAVISNPITITVE